MEHTGLAGSELGSQAITIDSINADVALPGAIQIDYADFLFSADYSREGPDLVIFGQDGRELVVEDYFSNADAADLRSPEGAILRGEVVTRLAGPENPGVYAQQGAIDGAEVIGQVEKLNGSASVQRADGTTEPLQIGTNIFQNDVVQTGDNSSLSLTFVDGTIFTLSSASRMVLDELIYDPAGSSNSAVFNLVEGTFVFIAGQVAKTGDMEVKTPVATMGIRGTTVLVDVQTINGVTTVEVSLNRDPDGGIGSFVIRDLDGNIIADVVTTDSKWIISPIGGETREIERTSEELAQDEILIAEARSAYDAAYATQEQTGSFLKNQAINGDDQDDAIPDEIAPQDNNLPGDRTDLNDSPDLIDVLVAELLTEVLPVVGDFVTPDLVDPLPEVDPDSFPSPDISGAGPLPVINLPDLQFSPVPEDGSFTIVGFSIIGVSGSSPSDVYTITIAATSTVTLVVGSGITLIDGTGNSDETVVFSGTIEQINSALNGMVYSPSPNHDVQGSLTISVFDGTNTAQSVLTIPITASPDSPTATDDDLDRGENSNVFLGNLLQNDTDPDTDDVLTITGISHSGVALTFGQSHALPGGGSITFYADGGYSLILGDNYNGLDDGDSVTETFSYSITDLSGRTDTASFVLTIIGQNDAPVIVDPGNPGSDPTNPIAADPDSIIAIKTVNVGEDFNITELIDISDFAVDPDGGSLIFTTEDMLPEGLTLNSDGTITGVVAVDADGSHPIVVSVFDGTDTSTVNLTIDVVAPVNTAPVGVDDDLFQQGDVPGGNNFLIYNADLLANDTDPNGDTLAITSVDSTSANGANLTFNEDGTISYAPYTSSTITALDQGTTLTDSFYYTVSDGNGGTDTAKVTLSVIGKNDAPTVVGSISDINVDEDSSSNMALPTNLFNDPDTNATLTYSAQRVVGGVPAALPAWITFTAATMIFAITNPGNADVGDHTIRVTATDEHGASTFTDFDITVDNVNDAPVVDQGIEDQSLAINSSANFSIPTDAFSDMDIGDTLTYTAFIQNGTSEDPLPSWLSFSNGTFSGNPVNGSGNFIVLVKATDGSGATAETTFTINISSDIIGTPQADSLFTNAADNHVLALAGDDVIFGSAGNDTIDGGDGIDTIDYSFAQQDLLIDLGAQTASGNEIGSDQFISIENAVGGSGNDQITGGAANERLDGNGGSDILDGGAGDDEIITGNANGGLDTVRANIGNDIIDVSALNDGYFALEYNNGAVITNGIFANITGTGGTIKKGVLGTDTLIGLDSIDTNAHGFDLTGTSFNDFFTINQNIDDWMQVQPGDGADTILVFGGRVTVDYSDAPSAIFANQNTGIVFDGYGNFDKLYGDIFEIRGSNFSDHYIGSFGDDAYSGMMGNDVSYGGLGFDRISFNDGGATGAVINMAAGTAAITYGATTYNQIFYSFEWVRGTSGSDMITGSAKGDRIDGYGGADIINAGRGDDDITVDNTFTFVDGGTGQDTLNLSGLNDLSNISGLVAGVETIDLTNAAEVVLQLSEQSVISISTETNDVLSSNGITDPDAILILGNVDDLVILGGSDSASGAWTEFSGRSFSYGDDYYDVYSFVENSTVLATIAIDDDVTISIV